MPIVRDIPSLYPDVLLEELVFQASARRWWALYTKVHQEKALARQLLGYQIPYYLPLVQKTSVWRGRRFISRVPLFAGYVFLFGTEEERVASLTTNRISRVLVVDDVEGLSRDLRQLWHLIASGAPLTVEQRLAPGQRVRVRSGLLAGLEGRVLKRHGATRLLVAVDFLQQGASVHIEDCLVEPLGSGALLAEAVAADGVGQCDSGGDCEGPIAASDAAASAAGVGGDRDSHGWGAGSGADGGGGEDEQGDRVAVGDLAADGGAAACQRDEEAATEVPHGAVAPCDPGHSQWEAPLQWLAHARRESGQAAGVCRRGRSELTRDARSIACRELDERLGLTHMAEEVLTDPRRKRVGQMPQPGQDPCGLGRADGTRPVRATRNSPQNCYPPNASRPFSTNMLSFSWDAEGPLFAWSWQPSHARQSLGR